MNRHFTENIFFPILLACATTFVFYPSVYYELTNWETNEYVLKNPYIHSISMENLRHIFTDIYFINYHPVTLLSFAVENHFFGINPGIMHGINVAFHVINVFLVYYFFRLISGSGITAFITGMLFAIHPLRVESVTWVVERKDVLFAFFYLLSLIHYIKYFKEKNPTPFFSPKRTRLWRAPHTGSVGQSPANYGLNACFPALHYFLSLLFFILSCMSKGMGVSLFLIVLLIDFIMKRKITGQSLCDKIPFLLIAVLFGIIAVYATHRDVPFESYNDYLSNSYRQYAPVERILLSCFAVLFYLFKFFYPFNLSVYYPYISQTGCFPGDWSWWVYPVLLILLFITVIFSLRYSRKGAFSFFFFLSTVLLILPFHPVNLSVVFDRYTYLGHCGIAFFISSVAIFFVKKNEEKNYFRTGYLKSFLLGVFFLWIFFMGYATRQRMEIWKNSVVLWSDYIGKFPAHFMGYLNRGTAYAAQGSLGLAIEDFNAAVEKDKGVYKSFLDRGNAYVMTKQYDKALADYSMVVLLNSNKPEVFLNRGSVKWILNDTAGACSDWQTAAGMGLKKAGDLNLEYCGK